MKKRKALSLLLTICLLVFTFGAAMADPSPKPTKTPKPTQTPMPTLAPSKEIWPALPLLTQEGYLVAEAGQQEFVHADIENGLWLYISEGLRIQIQRFTDPNMPLIWYEADIRTKGEELLHSVSADTQRPYTMMNKPEVVARSNRLVFALNDDQFVQRRTDKSTIGIIVRDGKVYNKTTRRSGNAGFPNLETMALFPDGSLRVYQSGEHEAQEYLDMGVTDVFAFGPILIRDGIINEKLNEQWVNSMQPRCGFGVVEPCHYVCVVAEGRHKGTDGTNLLWLANRLRMLGATQALNLDGGNTAALVFMGEKLNTNNRTGPDANVRSISGMIAIGVSSLVPKK